DLVKRTIGGGPQFWADFEDAADVLAVRMLERVKREPATAPIKAVLKALLGPVMALERERTWSKDYKLHFQTDIVVPGDQALQVRESLIKRVKDLLADT